MKRYCPKPGDLLALPLDSEDLGLEGPGGWCCALVGIQIGRSSGALLWIFEKRFSTVPTLEEGITAAQIRRVAAILDAGTRGIVDGRWHVIGRLPSYDSQQWPMPLMWHPRLHPAPALVRHRPADTPNYFPIPEGFDCKGLPEDFATTSTGAEVHASKAIGAIEAAKAQGLSPPYVKEIPAWPVAEQ